MFGLKCLCLVAAVRSHYLYLFMCVCAFFQDDASSVLHGPAVRAEAAGGLALVPGSPRHPDLLPGKRRMELLADLCPNSWQRLTVSTGMFCLCLHGSGVNPRKKVLWTEYFSSPSKQKYSFWLVSIFSVAIFQPERSFVIVCCQREIPLKCTAVCKCFESDRFSMVFTPHFRSVDLMWNSDHEGKGLTFCCNLSVLTPRLGERIRTVALSLSHYAVKELEELHPCWCAKRLWLLQSSFS